MKARKALLFTAVALVLAGMLAAAGCGGSGTAEDTSTATATTPTTAASTPAAQGNEMATGIAAAASNAAETTPATPSPAPAPAAVFEITDRQANPGVVAPGGAIMFDAWVRGDAASVTIKVYGQSSSDPVMTVPLAFLTPAANGIYRWSASTAAPAQKGLYRYYASAVSTSGATAEMPGASGWSFCVGDPAVDCGG